MTEPLSDRLLAAVGDRTALLIVRRLLRRPQSQAELVDNTKLAQSTVSRTVKLLSEAGLIAEIATPPGQPLSIDAPHEMTALLLAADRLAESILNNQNNAQRQQSRATRELAIQSVEKSREEDSSGSNDGVETL